MSISNILTCQKLDCPETKEDPELPKEILEALERLGEGSKPNIEETEVVNLAKKGEGAKKRW